MRNARACEACRASKNRCFFADEHTVCQRCEQSRTRCIVRDKARPRRARGAKTTVQSRDSPKLSSTSLSKSPASEVEFAIDLPATVYRDPTEDVEDLENYHNNVFSEANIPSTTPLKASPSSTPQHLAGRKITLTQATHLLYTFLPKLPFFPFIILPKNPKISTLSKTSPFLLLAILTVSSIPYPYLHHQIDHEFRRILSLKLIVESQKSLDFLQGLLVYIAWYPMHIKPRSNPCFMYMSLAISLATDLGLDQPELKVNLFSDADTKGLVDEQGRWTIEARNTAIGCYVLSSSLAVFFGKPQHFPYKGHLSTDADPVNTSIMLLQRISERAAETWTITKNHNMDAFNTEFHIQLLISELENWKQITPKSVLTMPLISLQQKCTHAFIYSSALNFLRKGYRPQFAFQPPPSPQNLHILLQSCTSYFSSFLSLPQTHYIHFNLYHYCQLIYSIVTLTRLSFVLAEVENWTAETTREKIGLSMYLEALCFRLSSLSSSHPVDMDAIGPEPQAQKKKYDMNFVMTTMVNSVKRSWEERVSQIVPRQQSVDQRLFTRGKCPIHDQGLMPYFENVDFDFPEKDFEDWISSGGAGGSEGVGGNELAMGWSGSGSAGDATSVWDGSMIGSTPVTASAETPGSAGLALGDAAVATAVGNATAAGVCYHDLWATMTCSWAEQPCEGAGEGGGDGEEVV